MLEALQRKIRRTALSILLSLQVVQQPMVTCSWLHVCIKNVDVQATRNGKGASPADPQHFLAEGDEKVELIRTLSKVKLTIPNSATVESDGAGGYRIKQFLPSRIQRILLKNERPYQSLFLNPFLESNTFTPGKKYADDWYTKPTDAAKDYVLYDRSLTTNGQ